MRVVPQVKKMNLIGHNIKTLCLRRGGAGERGGKGGDKNRAERWVRRVGPGARRTIGQGKAGVTTGTRIYEYGTRVLVLYHPVLGAGSDRLYFWSRRGKKRRTG